VLQRKTCPSYSPLTAWNRRCISWLTFGLISKVSLHLSYLTLDLPFYLIYLVAYKRFTDNVPLAIDLDLVRGVEKGVLLALYTNLGINGPEGSRICTEFAQESPKVADRRADLQKKLDRLESASGELLSLGA